MKKLSFIGIGLFFSLFLTSFASAQETNFQDFRPELQSYVVPGIDGNGEEINHYWKLKEEFYRGPNVYRRMPWTIPLNTFLEMIPKEMAEEIILLSQQVQEARTSREQSEARVFCNTAFREINQEFFPYQKASREGICLKRTYRR